MARHMKYPFEEDSSGDKLVTVVVFLVVVIATMIFLNVFGVI